MALPVCQAIKYCTFSCCTKPGMWSTPRIRYHLQLCSDGLMRQLCLASHDDYALFSSSFCYPGMFRYHCQPQLDDCFGVWTSSLAFCCPDKLLLHYLPLPGYCSAVWNSSWLHLVEAHPHLLHRPTRTQQHHKVGRFNNSLVPDQADPIALTTCSSYQRSQVKCCTPDLCPTLISHLWGMRQ